MDSQPNDVKKPISLAALKFTSENIEVAKELTTEGISEDERTNYIRKVSTFVGSEVFEFSTCNRVLYVGFDIKPEALSSKISEMKPIHNWVMHKQLGDAKNEKGRLRNYLFI